MSKGIFSYSGKAKGLKKAIKRQIKNAVADQSKAALKKLFN